MHKLTIASLAFFAFFFTITPTAFSQPSDDDSAGDDDSAVEQPVTNEESSEGIADEIGGIIDAASGIGEAKESGNKKMVWILVLSIVSLSIKLIVDLAHGPLLPKGKALRWVAVILGGVAGGISLLVSGLQGEIAGVPAVLMFLSGPLAVAFNELSQDVPVLGQISNILVLLGKKK